MDIRGNKWLTLFCLLLWVSCQKNRTSVTVPIELDHNRMLVEAEIQRMDGTWRKARLWIDSGNPSFYLSEALARDLGVDLSNAEFNTNISPPQGIRINGMDLNFEGVRSRVMFEPHWLFSTMHNDGNMPSTVLSRYHIIFDYPNRRLTIAEPGSISPQGQRAQASVHPETGIPQIDAVIDGDSLSFALDMGAAYSFVSDELLDQFSKRHPDWPRITGAIGCANMWGWWPPNGETLPVMRLPEMQWGQTSFSDVALVGVPPFSADGPTLGQWYSRKTARPVNGFLGPNIFRDFRVEIDYHNSAIYFQPGPSVNPHDMDMVGLTLRPEPDGSYSILGVSQKDGNPAVLHVKPGDILIQVDDLMVEGATMGTVVDALRGEPGETRNLVLERDGEQFKVEAGVMRFL